MPMQPGGAVGVPGGVMIQAFRTNVKDGTKVKAAVAKVEAGLTKEQLAEWKKLTGEKVGFDLHPHYGVGFGGFTSPAFQLAVPLAPPQAVPPPLPVAPPEKAVPFAVPLAAPQAVPPPKKDKE